MDSSDIFDFLVPAAFVAFGLYFIYRMVRHGGFRGAIFGARIARAVGEVMAEEKGPIRLSVKVHLLERDSSVKLVGLELVAKSIASYQTTPVTLSQQQALHLASLLQEAARGH